MGWGFGCFLVCFFCFGKDIYTVHVCLQRKVNLHLNCLMPLFNETTTIINVHVYISMYMFLLMSHICKIIDDFEIKLCQLHVGSFMLHLKNTNPFVKVCVADIYEKMFLPTK